jgi:hypothetical protein
MLAAWFGPDRARLDRVFRRSAQPYRRVDGVIVAADLDDLTTCAGNCLDQLINVTETGGNVGGLVRVWTNIAVDGTSATAVQVCNDWTDGTNAFIGRFGDASSTWAPSGPMGAFRCFAIRTSSGSIASSKNEAPHR